MIFKMKRSKLLLTSSIIFILFSWYVKYSCARSYKDIHHLLTDDEREEIFGHPFADYVPEYDVLHPVQVDARGRFLSRDLANGNARRKRDLGSTEGLKEPVFFKLSAFGQDFHLNVTINDELFSPNFKIEIRSNGSSEFHYEIDHCHYIGQLLPAEGNGNKVAVSNCDGLKGIIRTQQDVFVVHPLPDRLKLGKNNTRAHVIHRRSLSPTRVQSLEEALEKEKRSDSWCGVEDGSAVQQSDESESHVNFARSSANQKRTIESMIVVEKMMTKFYGVDQIKKYVPTIVNMAHGILADASIGANIKYMIHKLLILQQDMNGLVISSHAASTLTSFCKWTTGENEQDDKNPLHFDHAALMSKYNFCRDKNARAEDCGDILGLADLKGMCKQDTSCTLNKDTGLGTAFTLAHETAHNLGAEHDGEGNKCNDGVYIMATRASGKLTAFDWSPCSRNYVTKFLQTKQSGCLNDDAKNKVTIPKGLPGQLYNGNDQCVRMFGAGSRVCDIPDLKEKMCVNLHCEKPDGYCSSNDEPAADGTECGNRKWCRRGRCVPVGSKGYQDVDGNWGAWKLWSSCYPSCGKGLSVRERECDNPAPKGRGKLCEGKGAEYKLCNNAKCQPNQHPRMKQCKAKRNVQFGGGVTYNWIYDPYYSSGKAKCVLNCATTEGDTTTFGNVKDGTPCTDKPDSGLCINGQCETVGCDGAIASRAKTDRCGVCNGDGSSCSGGSNQGNRPKPGKGPKPGKKPKPSKPTTASGQLKKFMYNEKPAPGEYDVVISTIPAGARNIKIEEATASENNLFLEDADYNYIINYDTFLANVGPKKFNGAGTTFLFTKRNQKETITAPGPLKKSVTLLLWYEEGSTLSRQYEVYDYWNKYKVNYQYVKPGTQFMRSIESDFPDLFREIYEVDKELREAEGLNEDEEKPKMKWIMSSQECSVTCGGGIEVITSVCVREDDQSAVGDQFCEEKRPEDITKECNTQACPARWEIGEWTECTKSCNDGEHGVRSREVFCVEDSQGVELEVKDSKCKQPKPTSQEACGKQPCPAEWYTELAGQCSTSCGPGVQSLTVECIRINTSGKNVTVDEKECTDIKPPTYVACNVENPCNDKQEVEEYEAEFLNGEGSSS